MFGPGNIHNCNICSYGSKSIFFITSHVRRHHAPIRRPFDCFNNLPAVRCKACNFKTSLTLKFNNHLKPYTPTNYICKKCRFRTYSLLIWYKHFKSSRCPQTPTKIFECGKCEEMRTPYKNHLERHVIRKHVADKDIKWFRCHNCKYKAKTKSPLRVHIEQKHILKKYKCDKCKFETAHRTCLIQHTIRRHTADKDVKWFECENCKYKAKGKDQLKKHVLRYHTEGKFKKFKCDKCQYSAHFKSYLERHVIRKHTADEDVEWLECEHCDYKTKIDSNLGKHVKQNHMPVAKKLQCDQCGYRAARRDHLKRHVERMHATDISNGQNM